MILHPNAKINIGLQVGDTLPNGYHNIETVFYPIDLHDEIEINLTDGPTTFTSEGITIDCTTDHNLVVRTYNAMKQHFSIGNVDIHLAKHIPFGAGLGGGSSDAAFTAYALNLLFELNLTNKQLAQIVEPIGADCPFFIYNRPMFAQGIGTLLSPIDLDLSTLWLVLVKPDINIPTAAAYKTVPCINLGGIPEKTLFSSPAQWRETITNAFEKSVFPLYPQIAEIKNQLYTEGALYASMTGTGAAVYGLFDHRPNIKDLFSNHFVHVEMIS